MPLALTLHDLAPMERSDKAARALREYTLHLVTHAEDPAFALAYDALWEVFGPRGELERRSVLEEWLAGPYRAPGAIEIQYALLVAYGPEGALAGARDCYLTLDARGHCVVCLSHVLVLPAHRRSGLAGLLRAAPARLGRERLTTQGAGGSLLLAGEMEFWDERDPDSQVRLLAYGRSGFSALAPTVLPYCQPDFRDPATREGPPRSIPLVPVLRWVDHEEADRVPAWLAASFAERFYAVYGRSCDADELRALGDRARSLLPRDRAAEVPLCPLPTTAGVPPVPALRRPPEEV